MNTSAAVSMLKKCIQHFAFSSAVILIANKQFTLHTYPIFETSTNDKQWIGLYVCSCVTKSNLPKMAT